MSMRTDLRFENGKLTAADKPGTADYREDLPKVELGDRLATTAWAESLKKQAGDAANDEALEAATTAHSSMVNRLHKLVEQRNTQSPSEPQIEHLRKVKRNYDQLTESAARQNSQARQKVAERKAQVKEDFETSTGFSERDASEIRNLIRSMPEKERGEFIDQAINNGDGNVLGAVFRSHPSLSGLTQDQHQAQYRRAMLQHHPKGVKLLDALDNADSLLFDSFNDLLTADENLTAAQIRDKREAEAEKARAAHDAFSNA